MCNTWGTFKSPVPRVTHGKHIRGTRGRLVCIFVVCLLVLQEGLQGKICVRLGVVCPLVLREGYQGKACLHICSLSPGAPRRTPGKDFVRLDVVCPLVYSVRSARGRLVCVYVACPQESKAGFLGEGLFCRVFVTVSWFVLLLTR